MNAPNNLPGSRRLPGRRKAFILGLILVQGRDRLTRKSRAYFAEDPAADVLSCPAVPFGAMAHLESM